MTPAAELFALAGQADAIDAAGRMIARPVRAVISRAEILALALATENCWAVCIEAELLVRALAMPITGNDETDSVRDHAIQVQSDRVATLMAALRPQSPKEQDDGTH